MKNRLLKRAIILTTVIICCLAAGGFSYSQSLTFKGKLRTQLPTVNVTHSDEPVSDVKEVTVSVNQNGGICNITSNVTAAMKHGSKPVCLIEWDDPQGLSEFLNSLTGVVSGAGTHTFSYSLTMYDLDEFEPIHSSSFSVTFQAPIPPDEPILNSKWKLKDDTTDTVHELYNRNEEHLTLNAQVTPRNYNQVIKFGDLTCSIPEGQTSCNITVGETFIEAEGVVGTKTRPYTVTDPYDYISEEPNEYTYNWDFRPPQIISTHVNVSADMLPDVINDYEGESIVLLHNQAAVVIESPHDMQDPAFLPTSPTLSVRLDMRDLYMTDVVNYGGIPVEFDLGTLYGEQAVDIEPINEPLRVGNYFVYVYDFAHIRDGLYDFTFSTVDGNGNGDQEVIEDIFIDRYPPDIQFVINGEHYKRSTKPDIYSLSDITILAWGGWDDGTEIISATLNGETVEFESGTANVKRLANKDLPLDSQHYLSVTAQDATGNRYVKVLDFVYGRYGFTTSVDDVMQGVQPAKITLRQTAGPYCITTSSSELAQLISAEYINSKSRGCTIEWIVKPDGVDPLAISARARSTTIIAQGNVADAGTHPYHFKVHSYDPFGGSQVIHEDSGTFEVTPLAAPQLYVGPPQIALNFDEYRYALPADRQLSILSTVTAEEGSEITVELVDDQGNVIDQQSFGDVRSITRHTFRPSQEFSMLSAYDYKVRAYYSQQPDLFTEELYRFYTVPPSSIRMNLEHPDYVMDGEMISVVAKMGLRNGDEVEYDSTMGVWDIGFYTYSSELRDYVAVTEVVATDASGISRLPISSEQIMASSGKIFARAKLRTPYPEINITRQLSTLYDVPVLSLGEINVSLNSTQYEAPVPARFIAKVDYASRLDSSTAGDIIWQTSVDGDVWVEKQRKVGLTNQLIAFDEPGELFVRAIVVNQLNGQMNYTNTVHFVAKPLPLLQLSGSRSVAQGGIGVYEYSLNEYAQNNSVGSVQYSTDNKLTWTDMSPIQELALTERTNLIARILITPEGDTPYYIYDNVEVSIIPPRTLNYSFDGDLRTAENGEEVNLTARILSNTLYQESDFRYEMIMPNGDTLNDLNATYVLGESDFISGVATFLFRTWVDGLQLETISTKSVDVKQLIYDGLPPTDLIIQTPDRVKYSYVNVRLVKPRQVTLPTSVTISQDISLPLGGELEIVNQSQYMLRLLAKQEGTHPITVRYYDNRGNEREHTEFVTITEPPELRFEMKSRYFTENFRPPFRLSNSLSYRFGSPTDRLDYIEWYLNGELLFSNSRTIINQTIDEPGDYTITAKIFSEYGQTAEASDSFTLLENRPSICEPYWESRDRVDTLFANCKDYDGKVLRVGFTYLDGQQTESTTYRYSSPSMSFIEGFFDDSQPIEMIALDDSGAETRIIVTWPQGE